MKPAFVVPVLLVCLSAPVAADIIYDQALVLENGLAAGPGGFPFTNVPAFGAPIAIVGTISEVNAPFEDLLPAGPHEITYMFAGASCHDYSDSFIPGCPQTFWGLFRDGSLWVYLDTTPDADFTNGDTFTDGELVLVASQVEHRIWDNDGGGVCWDAVDWTSVFIFYDGTWYSKISNPQFVAHLDAEIDANVPAGLAALGYTFHVQSGDIHLEYHVATQPMTWGKVKSLYRN